MHTIHLEPSMVPASLRGSYSGKSFRARVCETMTIPLTAGLWDGGSRDTYTMVRLEDGAAIEPINHNAAPWNAERHDIPVKIEPGIVVIEHTIFCGKDMGLTFYLHPDNATRLLPAAVELTDHERIVLQATLSFKSSYMGRDRYEMAHNESHGAFPARIEWDHAKQSLIAKGMLNRAGAITNKGRNAIPSRY